MNFYKNNLKVKVKKMGTTNIKETTTEKITKVPNGVETLIPDIS